jgi:type VI secretion system lysozyme-like protein
MPGIAPASVVPLFDRLGSSIPGATHGRQLDAVGLGVSLVLDLERLLNSRNSLTFEQFFASEGSVIDYGLPEFGWMSPRSLGDRSLLGLTIKRAIELYEPRMRSVHVEVNPSNLGPFSTHFSLIGVVSLGASAVRAELNLFADQQGIRVEVAD